MHEEWKFICALRESYWWTSIFASNLRKFDESMLWLIAENDKASLTYSLGLEKVPDMDYAL